MTDTASGKVFFIGAGPGDPELITLKGARIIRTADRILYAGSLVPEEIFAGARTDAERFDTSRLPLERQLELMSEAAKAGKIVARLHTGDPSVFGAIDEQMRGLRDRNVPFEIIPGVSSAFAAAAALEIEYTLPERSQTLILTRASGRTPVPEKENLRELAKHRCSIAIFLSASLIPRVVSELTEAGYPKDSAIAVVYRASWRDQAILRGTIETIEAQLQAARIDRQSLIIVSPALDASRDIPRSFLYGGYQAGGAPRAGCSIFALTEPAIRLGKKLLNEFTNARLFIPEAHIGSFTGTETAGPRLVPIRNGVREALQNEFRSAESLICVMAAGIVVRSLAPVLSSKHTDPAVVVLDPQGAFAVSLLSGHEGGANALAHRIAEMTGGQAVVTTAGDNAGVPPLDIIAKNHGWKFHPRSDLPGVMSALINGRPVTLFADETLPVPQALTAVPWAEIAALPGHGATGSAESAVYFTLRDLDRYLPNRMNGTAILYPAALNVGVGCNRGTDESEILEAIETVFAGDGLSLNAIRCLASVEDKRDEPGLVALAKKTGWELRFFSRAELESVADFVAPSPAARKALGIPAVAEPAALLAAASQKLLIRKRKFTNVTVAVSLAEEDA